MKKIKTINRPQCYFCGRTDMLEVHHIFPAFNRKHSEEDGLCVWLCHYHHNEPPDGVHFNKTRMEHLKKVGQAIYEQDHTRDEWRQRYGKSYL